MKSALIAGIIVTAFFTGAAQGGAWPQPEGQLLVIATSGRKVAPISSLFSGVPEEDSNTAQLFAEYGLLPELTLGLTAYGEFSTTDDVVEARIGAHVRHLLWQGDYGDVMSVQAGVSFPVERWLGNGLGDNRPDSASEVDLRVQYGRGVQWDWGDSFVSGAAGLRIRGEGLDEELKGDITLGHTPTNGVLGLFSVFASVPLGERESPTLKLAPSIAYTFWPILGSNDKKPEGPLYPSTIQLGVLWDAANPDDGLTVQVSVWKRF
ncbi:MAG: hypothetical protein AAF674_05645 [Pseudomonadota bacterium]